MAFDATTGAWEDAAFSIAVDAKELLGPDGHLYRVTDDGLVDRGAIDDFEALIAADVAIEEAWDNGAPEGDDWVLVLGDGEEAGHRRLLDVATEGRFAWQGRVFDTRVGSDGTWEVRDSGQVLARVTETFKRMAVDEVIDLEVAYPDGSVDVLTGTREHPFWVEAAAAWVPLWELAQGDVLTTYGGGKAVVVGLGARPGAHEVFNIEVDGPHNYFVRADGSDAPSVLVHNKGGGCTIPLGKLPDLKGVPGVFRFRNYSWRNNRVQLLAALNAGAEFPLYSDPYGATGQYGREVAYLLDRGCRIIPGGGHSGGWLETDRWLKPLP